MKLRALVLLDYDIPEGGLIEGAEEQKRLQAEIDKYVSMSKKYSLLDCRHARAQRRYKARFEKR